MKNHQYHFILLCILTVAYLTHTMEQQQLPVNAIAQENSSSIPTLYSLCKNKIITGYGNTYAEQCKDALKSIAMISDYMDDNFIENFKRSFVRHHMGSLCTLTQFAEQSPSILMNNNNKLYGMVDKSMYIWDLSITDSVIVPKKIYNLYINSHVSMLEKRRALASKNSSLLYITGTGHGAIKLWDTNSDECKGIILPDQPSHITGLSENTNGDPCTTDINGNIKIWDITTEKCKQAIPRVFSDVSIFNLLADTHMLYAAGGMGGLLCNGPILIYDTRVGECIDGMNPHGRAVIHLAKSKKDMQFYSSSHDKTIRVWDMRNMKGSVHVLNVTDTVHCIEENKEGTLLFSCSESDMGLWDLTTDKPSHTKKMIDKPVRYMAQDTDESQLFISTKAGIEMVTFGCTFDAACKIINNW